ncbi:amino acid adenylation domain-containing protein [Streptomyces sp. NPDC058657]|uniref:amino acid adenylation domain-containing protein n=1 Tax=unclassified Streptomyces TaxID=2593676 RepID=UPI00364B7992
MSGLSPTPGTLSGLAASVLDRARRHPSAPALVDGPRRLSYAELDAASASVAAGLRAYGVRPGQAVALCLPRSWQLVCTMLGVLRAGAVVVPLDAQSPPDRRSHILTDSSSRVVVHGEGRAPSASELPHGVGALSARELLAHDGTAAPIAQGSFGAPGASFLFYTSGSTGRPKGVEVLDAGILRLALPGYLPVAADGARFACTSNPAFDALSFEVWVPLLTGGCCVILGDDTVQKPQGLADALERLDIDVLFITAALFNAVVDKVPHCFSGVGQVLVGGEQLNARLIRRWYLHNRGSSTQLHNVYGPTEATTFALSHPVPREFDGEVVPIGRPLPGTHALAVVDGSRIAEPGETAELLLAGDALAAGYRNLPEESARRFVTLPWYDGGARRHYRTGDLVHRDAEGRYSYVERADRQVKVRGFRIEPGELERRIVTHPAVRQAYVCTRRDAHGVNELLAHLVLGAPLSYEDFARHVADGLPSYMRPHHTYLVDELPLNANGKVDRDALLSRTDAPWRGTEAHGAEQDAPAALTDTQRELLVLAASVTGVEGLRVSDRWIAVGGDSLKALRLRFEVRRIWGVELPQGLVLSSDFAGLAGVIGAGRTPGGSTGGSPYPTPAAPAGAVWGPATAEQERLWLLQQQDPGSLAYQVPLAFRVAGRVDVPALRHALCGLVARHPALRTSFEATPGGLRQVVAAPYDPWHEPAAGAARGGARDDIATAPLFTDPFDLSRPELLRACWVPRQNGQCSPGVQDGQDGQDGGELLLSLHHIAVDGWSLNVLFGELSADYTAAVGARDPRAQETPSEAPAAPTPLDFAAWQSEWFPHEAYRDRRAQLRALHAEWEASDTTARHPSGPLEPVRTTAELTGPAGQLLHTVLTPDHRAGLDRLCGDLGLTRFQILQGLYAWSLYGVTGRTRLRMAGPVANRPVREFESGVGMFANTVLLPVEVAADEPLLTQVRRIGARARAVLDCQDVTLADALVDAGGSAEHTPFDFLFVLENTDFGALALPGCRIRPRWLRPAAAKCPLTLSVIAHGGSTDAPAPHAIGGPAGGLDCLWEYDARYFDAAEVAAMAELFRAGLDRLTHPREADGSPGPADTLAGLVTAYRSRLPEPGRADPVPLSFSTVAEGFARQVHRSPGAPALVSGDSSLTYGQLDYQAARLAGELAREFSLPGPDDGSPACVALHLPPSVEHVVALLALARLQLTAVPLDPSYPPALLRQVLDAVRPLCVLVPPGAGGDGDGGPDRLADIAGDSLPRRPVVLAADTTGDGAVLPAPVPRARARPLYTLFTSGSTGVPKGVQVPDSTLCNLIQWQQDAGGLGRPAVTQQFSMLSFDVSFQEIFSTLCGGGSLHLVRPQWRQDAPALLEQLESAGVERLFLPYVALQLLAEHGVRLGRFPSRLREVVTAGEQLLCTDAITRWFSGMPGARLFNHYGPTETHVVSSLCLEGDPARWPQRPAIGSPVAGAWLRVVDDAGLPLPPGRPGHLLIGGAMAAPCYLDDPALDAARFVTLPGQGTFYRSGDLAHFDQDGLLHYRGRDDQQIKLSGHRLELGQIEAALLQHEQIVNAVVVREEKEQGGTAQERSRARLVACVQLRDGARAPDHEELVRHLAPLLPPYVRIDRFRVLARLPLTPSGKLDRRSALDAPGEELRSRADADVSVRPVLSAREARLTELFEAVLGLPVGPDERFFDAGATSLGLMRFHLRCTAEPDLKFSIPDLFEHVTVRRLAAYLDQQHIAGSAVSDEPSCPAAGAPDVTGAEPIAVVGMAVRVPGADDLAAFWELVRTGGSGVEHFDAAEGLVGARSQMSGLLSFDPEHFGISRQEARLMDPQQRHLLMSCVQALAHAGIAPQEGQEERGESDEPRGRQRTRRGPIGLVAGCGENTYFQSLLREGDPERLPDGFQLALHHEKDFLTTKVAYHLGLSGPAFTLQAACASSLVAVHVAAGLLRQGDAEVMLAGGVLVDTLLTDGYPHRSGHIFSADGHCRGFSDDASGTIGASGVGVVVLKPLRLARRDGDTVYAVLSGSAVNNDGSAKLSYSAPSLPGQREVIRAALRRSGRTGADLGYVEAHGTGTPLGDPVEVGALRQAFGPAGADRCALASVKSQIGHLGAAAGIVGLVRAVLAVHHGVIPPQVGFRRLNPQIGRDAAPFSIPTVAAPWPSGRPRVAAVSSFGIGGTNAHAIVEEAPGVPPEGGGAWAAPEPHKSRSTAQSRCLLLSSSSPRALREDAARIADHLEASPGTYDQVLRHLRAGRPSHRWRVAVVCDDASAAVTWLRTVAEGGTQPADAAGGAEAGMPLIAESGTQRAGASALATGSGADGDEVSAWLAGRAVDRGTGPAQAPWDFPPPAFALAEYDFERGAPRDGEALDGAWPERVEESRWLHQPHWVRLSRATTRAVPRAGALLVAVTAEPLPPGALLSFEAVYDRVVQAVAADGFGRLGEDLYAVDPADPGSLRLLLDALLPATGEGGTGEGGTGEGGTGGGSVDWLHALPLAARGPVDAAALARARWACLDAPAALLRAAAGFPGFLRLRPWWLSYGAQPVEGPVLRPELGLLAGAAAVAGQECEVDGRWLDLPDGELSRWSPLVAGLLAGAVPDGEGGSSETAGTLGGTPAPERRIALRQGYWWRQALLPVSGSGEAGPSPLLPVEASPSTRLPPERPLSALPPGGVPGARATYVILGGTGGIGRALAAHLLTEVDCRVVLVARHARLPQDLDAWSDRVNLVEADLATATAETVLARLEGCAPRIDGVVHAVGVAGGGLLVRRDAAAMTATTAAKLHGALLVEQLITRHRPAFAVYCSSMSALFGGVGQFDYAAANGLLDGFARYSPAADESTVRLSIGWDIWREGGMAERALHTDARHQAHLSVGLTAAEGQRLFARALRLPLPHLMVSATAVDRAPVFYAAPAPQAASASAHTPVPSTSAGSAPGTGADPAARLLNWLCQWLGLAPAELDPEVSLYDYGADSLTMIDLITKVEDEYGISIELAHLSHRVSLNEILARAWRPPVVAPDRPAPLESGARGGKPPGSQDRSGEPSGSRGNRVGESAEGQDRVVLEVWQEGSGDDLVCLVHPVGGDIQAYRSLVSALDPALTVCLIADPALRGDGTQEPSSGGARSLAGRAGRYRAALQERFPHGPWRWQLAGWSFGAWVAHAMAAEAEAAGRPAEGLHLLDPPPPDAAPRFLSYDEEGIEAVFLQELAHGGGQNGAGTAQAQSPAVRAYAERLARCCRANLAAMSRHSPPQLADTPTHLWLANRPVEGFPGLGSPDGQLVQWKAVLTLVEGAEVLDTTHYGIVRPPHTARMADAIGAAVARAHRTPSS